MIRRLSLSVYDLLSIKDSPSFLCLQSDHYIHTGYNKYTIISIIQSFIIKICLMNLDKITIQNGVHHNAQVWRIFRLNSCNSMRLNYWSYIGILKLIWKLLRSGASLVENVKEKKSKMTSGYNITKHIGINEYNI